MSFQRQATGRHPVVSTAPTQAEPKPDRLMRAVALMLFTYVWRIQDAFPILGKLQLALLALAAAVVMYASVKNPVRRMKLVTAHPTSKLIAALMIIMIIGVPFSIWRGHSAEFVLKSYLPDVIFYGLVAATVRTIRDVEWYALMNLYGALIFATVVALFFSVGGDGRLGSLVYYDANDFALVTVCTIPFGLPVVPDVYRMNKLSSAPIISGSQCLATCPLNLCHHTSRPDIMSTSISRPNDECLRWTTSTCLMDGHSTTALSAFCLSGTT